MNESLRADWFVFSCMGLHCLSSRQLTAKTCLLRTAYSTVYLPLHLIATDTFEFDEVPFLNETKVSLPSSCGTRTAFHKMLELYEEVF